MLPFRKSPEVKIIEKSINNIPMTVSTSILTDSNSNNKHTQTNQPIKKQQQTNKQKPNKTNKQQQQQ